MNKKSPGIAVGMLVFAAVYLVLNVVFYYDGFFRYWHNHLELTSTAMYLDMGGGYVSIVPWARLPIFFATLGALLWLARAMWRGAPSARLTSFFVFVGLVLPQARFMQIYLHDFRQLSMAGAGALALLAASPMLLLASPSVVRRFDDAERALSWSRLPFGRARLIGVGVLVSWLFFVAEAYLARYDYIPDGRGLWAASATMLLAPLVLFGLARLRTWAVFVAPLVGVLVALCALVGRGSAVAGHFLSPCSAWNGAGATLLLWAPALALAALVAPFWRAALRRL